MSKVNKKTLSEIVGISERTLTEYQKDPTFPIEEDNGRGKENVYETVDVIKWLILRETGKKAETARERLDRIKADREELAFAKDLEELVPAALVEETLANVVIAIRSDLLNSNAQLKVDLDIEYDIETDIDILHDHSRKILEHLSEIGGEPAAGGFGDDEEIHASAEDGHPKMG